MRGGALPRVYGNDLNNNGVENEADDGQHIACNWISSDDALAFADWSGLRPYSELEFEKACRGVLFPYVNENAWGNTNATYATSISNPGLTNEVAGNVGANYAFNNDAGVQGPLRCGSFARAATNREQAGATYYGVMEMSGNLWEYVVSVGILASRSFNKNNHGNGSLTVAGVSDVVSWPVNMGIRGGAFNAVAAASQVSDRGNASSAYTSMRYQSTGIRLARANP